MSSLSWLKIVGCLGLAMAHSSCGALRSLPGVGNDQSAGGGQPINPQLQGWALMYPELASGNPSTGSSAITPGVAPGPAVDPQGGTPTSAEGGLYDFSTVVQTGTQNNPGGLKWNQSAHDAIDAAKRSGKPLLIFFAHRNSQPSQAIENTMIRTPQFRSLAQEHFELLRLDYSDQDTRSSDYYRDFKKQLKVNGYPTLVITLPDGTEVFKESGFKPEYQENHLKRLDEGLRKAEKLINERRENLKSQGYRLWTNKDGKPVFAKLSALDANKATFTGEWGKEFKTFTNRLSTEDQAWIESKRQAAQSSAP